MHDTVTNHNPLIQDKPADTLFYARSVLQFIQDYYCASDLDRREADASVHTGLFFILRCAEQAIAFEEQRLSDKPS